MSPSDIFILFIFGLVTAYAIKGTIDYWRE